MPDDADADASTALNKPLTSYAHLYPSPSAAVEFPFVELNFERRPDKDLPISDVAPDPATESR